MLWLWNISLLITSLICEIVFEIFVEFKLWAAVFVYELGKVIGFLIALLIYWITVSVCEIASIVIIFEEIIGAVESLALLITNWKVVLLVILSVGNVVGFCVKVFPKSSPFTTHWYIASL